MEWIIFEHDSGEIIFVKRSAIKSFHPKYVHPKGYIIYAVVGDTEKPVHRCSAKDEARDWCEEQVRLLSLPVTSEAQGGKSK